MARSGPLALRLTKLVADAPGGHPVTDDLAQAILDLQSQEVAYKGALGAAAKALQPTLLDFLS